MPLVDLGVDSLVAVEVRTWFMQESGVNLPVLKILGGASVADLADDAMQKFPPSLLSRFEEASAEKSPTSETSTASVDSAPSSSSSNGGGELESPITEDDDISKEELSTKEK